MSLMGSARKGVADVSKAGHLTKIIANSSMGQVNLNLRHEHTM
jgi:hypothetical protein